MNINYKRPKLTSYQREIIDAVERYTITEASTKTGKTASHIVWLFEQALQLKENQSVWWVAPVFSQSKIAFRRLKAQINVKGFFKVNESELTLTLPNGAKIQFKSAEKPDNLYGDDVYAAVFDEASRAKEESWIALRSTLTATQGKCKLIGNSKGKKNWMYKMGQRAKSGEPNYRYFKITAYDAVEAGILSFEEVEQAKRDMPEAYFRELYLCEPTDDGANPFGYSHIQKQIKPISSNHPVCFGIDLAKTFDHTVIVGLDSNGDVCVFERFQGDWTGQVKKIVETVNSVPCLIDSTGVGDSVVEQIQRAMPNVEGFKFTSGSKQQIMEALALSIQQGTIGYPEEYIVNELEQFEFFHTTTGVKYSAPSGVHDDCVCALALANYKKISTISNRYVIF